MVRKFSLSIVFFVTSLNLFAQDSYAIKNVSVITMTKEAGSFLFPENVFAFFEKFLDVVLFEGITAHNPHDVNPGAWNNYLTSCIRTSNCFSSNQLFSRLFGWLTDDSVIFCSLLLLKKTNAMTTGK
jgi:hypothetical protein